MKRTCTILGYLFCILPPILCTLEHIPLWLKSKETVLSAVALLLLVGTAFPLWLVFKKKKLPLTPWSLWLVLFLLLSFFRPIVDSLWTIALLSLCTSLVGCAFFAVAKHIPQKARKQSTAP